MPPPMSPQGSRAGLITAVVVLSILFVTSAIFAFYFSAENSKTTSALNNQKKDLNRFASDNARQDAAIIAAADAGQNSGQSAIEVLLNENTQKTAALSTATQQNAQLKKRVDDLTAEANDKTAQLDDASKKMEAEVAQRKAMAADLQKQYDDKSAELSKALGDLAAAREKATQNISKAQQETGQAMQRTQGQLSTSQKTLEEREAQIAALKRDIEILNNKLAPYRADAKEASIRQADGRILRVPGNDNVYINIGLGDQVTPGMTFEVYDRFAGIPGLGAEPDAGSGTAADPTVTSLPKGKATIEIVRPANRQSECRIIRQSPGQPVVEGDIIANLVYDKNTKHNFVVFGDFDLDQNGTPTPGDNEVVQRLITQWGGKVQQAVSVSTDFIVLGFEPEVPLAEENESPTDRVRREAAEAAAAAYNAVRDRAIDMNIPILNQNRFLYYVGYFEQAQR